MYTDPTGKFACLAPTAVRTEAGHRSAKQYIAFCNEQSNRLNTSKATGKLSRIRAIDGLLELFADPELPGGTGTQATQRRQKRLTEAQERLEFILWYTTDGPMVNFNNIDFWTGEGVKRSDEGFALELRDSDIWVASSRQVGHFLTAANMGYSPSFMERSFTACIVGHEKLGDQTGIRHNLFQCLHSSNIDVMLFEAAANADREGNYALRDCFIGAILPDLPESLNPSATNGFEDPRFNVRSGNSRQDLRLSIKGWIFGQKIRDNEITTLADAQSWIRREIQE